MRRSCGMHAALASVMARPHPRDLFTWLCTVPASTLLIICLVLPQVRDGSGHVKTPFETDTWPMMIVIAVLGVLPILWRWRPAQRPILVCIGTITAGVLIMSVVGIAALLVLAFVQRLGEEEIAALCGFCLVLAFLILFPLVGLFTTFLVGAELTWGAAWLMLIGMIGWASASARR
jgi:hypothetical protein